MREIIASLIKLADHLDNKGFSEEASLADDIIKSVHAAYMEEPKPEEKEEEKMMPMKNEKEMDEAEACVMKDADANLQAIQLRRRARSRRLLNKES